MSLHAGPEGKARVFLTTCLGAYGAVLGLVAQARSEVSMSLQRIVRVSLEHPTCAVCVAGVETLVDFYG